MKARLGAPLLAALALSLAWDSAGTLAQTARGTRRTIRVAMDNAYAPYAFRSDAGTVEGILVDQWRAWERVTGVKVEIHAMDWSEALRRTRGGEFDVIDCIVETPERRADFDFAPAYAAVEASIFFRQDIPGITNFASLQGFPVGVKTGDQHVDRLRENGVTTVIPFPNNRALIDAARQHKINVFVADAPSVRYLLYKEGIAEEYRHSAPLFRDSLRRAVRKGDSATLNMVSRGFAAVGPAELRQIDEKWFGRTISRYGLFPMYGAYSVAAALLVITLLLGRNYVLRRGIRQRTTVLAEREMELDASTQKLHTLAQRLMRAQDDERRRLAQMLHETTAQDLAGLKMHLARLNRTTGHEDESDRAGLSESISLADQVMRQVRTLSYLLHPPFLDETGLLSALRWFAAGFAERSGITVDLELPESLERLPLNTETALFRIVQESLNNIHRHAESEAARIRLARENGALVLAIEDRGRGIPAELLERIRGGYGAAGVGIAGMFERIEQLGGQLEILSSDRGTTVRVRLPLVSEAG